jgi:hypothetical protein
VFAAKKKEEEEEKFTKVFFYRLNRWSFSLLRHVAGWLAGVG